MQELWLWGKQQAIKVGIFIFQLRERAKAWNLEMSFFKSLSDYTWFAQYASLIE